MKRIHTPDYEVTLLDDITRGVRGLRVLIVNVYMIYKPNGNWVLVDTGLPHSANRIKKWAEQKMGPGSKPESIILTHGHFDHVGAVEELVNEWDVPVYAHPLEIPFLTGQAEYPHPDPSVGGGHMSILSTLYPRGPIDLGYNVEEIPYDNSVPGLPAWNWISTPGHTKGHISLFRKDGRTLLAGDAISTVKVESFVNVALQKPELHGPPAYFTTDWGLTRRSVEWLANLKPLIIAPGHGLPMIGADVANALDEFASKFEEITKSEKGRYVD
ncbi:MAG: MBL fold metallo-hydrolase [Balneolales bacterium]